MRRGTLRRGGVKWKNWALGALGAFGALGLASSSAKPVNSWVSGRQPNAVYTSLSNASNANSTSLANSSAYANSSEVDKKDLYDLIIETKTVLTFSREDPYTLIRKIESSGLTYKFNTNTNYYEFFLESSPDKHAYATFLLGQKEWLLSLYKPEYSQIDMLLSVLVSAGASFLFARQLDRRRRIRDEAANAALQAAMHGVVHELQLRLEEEPNEDGEEVLAPPQGGRRKTHKRR